MKDFYFYFLKWAYNFKREKHKYVHHWKLVKYEFSFFHFDKFWTLALINKFNIKP
jgi:hypothetical protein